jgi:hypothetical protein
MRLALTLALLCCCSPALAWGPLGHRVTGQIAQQHLSPKAAAAVQRILGVEDLAEASTWADEMRSNPAPFWQKTASPWHYVTVPAGKFYAEVGAPPEGDSVTALQQFAATLRDRTASREQQQLALRFAVHIIGDLQQPLHAGNGTDKGGNELRVRWFSKDTNLHSVWDSDLPLEKALSYTEYSAWLMRRLQPADRKAWSTADPLVWIAESAELRDRIYPTENRLSYDYIYQNAPVVDRRLTQGGLRIAAWLNEVLR